MANGKTLKKGDAVSWDASQGEVRGKVVKRLTSQTRIKDHVVKASPEHPEYLVKSDRTGAEAAHRPEELRKR